MSNSNEKSRYIKVVSIDSVNDICKIESLVNKNVNRIRDKGGKVVNISTQMYGISPMNLIYTIVYERESEIPEENNDERLQGNGEKN